MNRRHEGQVRMRRIEKIGYMACFYCGRNVVFFEYISPGIIFISGGKCCLGISGVLLGSIAPIQPPHLLFHRAFGPFGGFHFLVAKLYSFEFKWSKPNPKPPALWLETYPEASFEAIHPGNYLPFIAKSQTQVDIEGAGRLLHRLPGLLCIRNRLNSPGAVLPPSR
jgi:hypothetical protein